MMNSWRIKYDEVFDISSNILSIEDNFFSFENNTLEINDIDFTDIELFNICNDKFYFKYQIKSDDQANFSDDIKTINGENSSVELSISKIKKVKFTNCSFSNFKIDSDSNIIDISFCGSSFDGNFYMINKENSTTMYIKDCSFNSGFFIQKSHFKKLRIEETMFEQFTNFKDCLFEKLTFQCVIFLSFSNFSNSIIKNELDLIDVSFKENPNFFHAKWHENEKILNVANRETARILKHSFEKQKNIIEANKYYALEMKKYEQELSWYNDFSNKLIFMIHGKSSNHSQNWLLILFWIVIVSILGSKNSFVCSLYYFCISDEQIKYIAQSFAKISTFKIKDITLYSLLIKASMSYLIYQFIITVRQNTRRK